MRRFIGKITHKIVHALQGESGMSSMEAVVVISIVIVIVTALIYFSGSNTKFMVGGVRRASHTGWE